MYDTIQRTIAAWAFNHYIAYYYFDNVNVSQLKVAFERGEVELENLPIKRDALSQFNLPMSVVSGIVGRLSIKVPLLTLLTDPWVIKITNLMLIVEPKKQNAVFASTSGASADDSLSTNLNEKSQLEIFQEANNVSMSDSAQPSDDSITSEETKLAEFCSSFSATVNAMVKDIYKNIRLEIESMSILFENFEHGIVRFDVDSLLLHRPKAARSLVMSDLTIYLSSIGSPSMKRGDNLLQLSIDNCNLNVHDEVSANMQLVLVEPEIATEINKPSSSRPKTSETRVEGTLKGVSIEQLRNSTRNSKKLSDSNQLPWQKLGDDPRWSKRAILDCDTVRVDFKLNNNRVDEPIESFEKNFQIKLDLVRLQYIHSQKVYEMTKQRLMDMLKFFIDLQTGRIGNQSPLVGRHANDGQGVSEKAKSETIHNKLLIINVEEGLLYVVDDSSSARAIPLLEFSLDDLRVLHFSGRNQQNGFIFAKIGCNYFNREISSWDPLLHPWPFNLAWDLKLSEKFPRTQHRQISLGSDETADFVLSSAFLDICDVSLGRILDEFLNSRHSTIATNLRLESSPLPPDYSAIFMLHNETGHRLEFAPIEELTNLDLSPLSSPVHVAGDESPSRLVHKLSIQSQSSTSSRDSPDPHTFSKWKSVEVGEAVSFEFESLPIYRRHFRDRRTHSRNLLVRVEGWKTLAPICIDHTGSFYREACSDRVRYENTFVVISVNLEENSARKIISIKSPLSLVNLLDATLEAHFVESNQALYIKPETHLTVPLPLIGNTIHIRPCNVGVTVSDRSIAWTGVQNIFECESRIHICDPITVTDTKHASYCPSQPYRICVSTTREKFPTKDSELEVPLHQPIPVFTTTFRPPLTLINMLPCELHYSIGVLGGTLTRGAQQKICHVDTTKPNEVYFQMHSFPSSKPLLIDPGATGSFNHTLEMFDKKNRSLYLKAKILLFSQGEEPAVQVIIYASFWLLNKTRLPLIFKQEGAPSEAAGQYHEHEESPAATLLYSFYDQEIEPPHLCSMRLGKSKGSTNWCEGFKLEKGNGERRLSYVTSEKKGEGKLDKHLIDINIHRGYGRYSDTLVVIFTSRYGFDPTTKTPKKSSLPSPQNYKLTSYNHNVNLADKLATRAVNLFNSSSHRRCTSDLNTILPGIRLTLVDGAREKFLEGSMTNIVLKCTTNAKDQILDCSAQEIRFENVMPDCEKAVMLDRATILNESLPNMRPAIRLIMDRILGNSFGTTLFRQVQVSLSELLLNLEEKLVLKLCEFVSFRRRRRPDNMNNLGQDLDKILFPEENRRSKYYFDLLRIDLSSLKLGVFTSTNLTSSLQKLKSYLGLKFFAFEEAQIELAPYFKMNVSRTFREVFDSVTRFYKRQILEQAPRIVGQQIQNYLRFHLSDLLSTLYDEVYNKLFI